VIDTNVLIVSNDQASHASPSCVIAAVDFLSVARSELVVILDDNWEIFEEYKRYCSFKGQPGLGDRFFLELYRAMGNRSRVHLVRIHGRHDGSYEEIPSELSNFDPSDLKFVAAVVADNRNSVIVNCVDSDWRESANELAASGIRILEICAI
jgi:hypothetical protein